MNKKIRERWRRVDYVFRVLAASQRLPKGLHHAIVTHEDGCMVFHGSGCTCNPEIKIVPDKNSNTSETILDEK